MRGIRFIGALVVSFFVATASASAICDVSITDAPTTNMSPGPNFTPIASPANLDVDDLNAALSSSDASVDTNGGLCLLEPGNLFIATDAKPIAWGSGRSLSLTADADISISNSPFTANTSTSDLTMTAGGATGILQDFQSPIVVGGSTSLSETTDDAEVDVDDADNDFGSLGIDSHGPVGVRDVDGLVLSGLDNTPLLGGAADPVNLTVGGALTQTGPVVAAGTTQIDTTSSVALGDAGNDFGGSVSIPGPASAVTLRDSGALDLGTIDVTGSLDLDAGGAITQSAGITAGGQTDATGQSLTLTHAANDFDQARFEATGGDASAADADAITLTGAGSATGSFQVIAGTNMTVTGNQNADALTLVVDEAAGNAVGPGGLTIQSGVVLTSSGAPLRLYTSKRSQNSISAGANLNGATFTPGTLYVDTAREIWGVAFPDGTATDPFTIFYKDEDTTAPQTTFGSGPADGSTINDPTPTFSFSSSEPGSTFACSVDGGGFSACTSPQTLGPLGDGQHTFAVRATDGAGNTDPTPASRAFTIDATPPQTTIDTGPSDGSTTNDPTPTFTFSASESGSTFKCKVDDGSFSSCTSPRTLAGGLADGQHTFQVRATDAEGNTDATPASRTFTVDTGLPQTTIDSGPAEGSTTNDPTPTFTFSASESGSTFECKVDDGSFSSCTSPRTLAGGLADGPHTFEVKATDAVGNADSTSALRNFTVDTAAPQTTITSGPATNTNDATPTFGFSSEPGATFECKVDGGSFSACSSPRTLSGGLGDGQHTFAVRATDGPGNTDATPASRTFTVDTQPPPTTIDSGPAGTTNDPTPTFTFSSSESGAKFACSVDGAPFSGCTSPRTTGSLADRPHTFAVKATDAADNTDATPASRTFTVDTGPPQTTIASGPDDGSTIGDPTPTFSFDSDEPVGATFECSVDDGPFAPCSSPRTLAAGDGSHDFAVRATDLVGNTDPTPAQRSFTVDTTPPETAIDSGPAEGSTIANRTPTFAFSASESGSTFACSVDGAPFASCDSPLTVAALADGAHSFRVRATDAVGNRDEVAAERTFAVDAGPPADKTAPDTKLEKAPKKVVKTRKRKAKVRFEFRSTEGGSSFQCSLDGVAYSPCTSPKTYKVGIGEHLVVIRATDAAGNKDGSPVRKFFRVKRKR